MGGWHISIERQRDGGSAPATFESATDETLQYWETHLYGLRWADALAKAGDAIDLGGNGYPCRYTAQARVLQHSTAVPIRLVWNRDPRAPAEGPAPNPRKRSLFDCPPGEWLVIEAWDQS